MCCPPHRGQVPWWKQRELCFGFRVWYGQTTGTNLQVRWLSLRFSCPNPLTCSSTVMCKALSMYWTCAVVTITWDCSQPELSDTARAKEQEKGWQELHFLLGPCASLGCCPVQEHIHLGRSHLLPTHHIAWDLTCGYSGMQGSLKESALSKMHAVVVCVLTPVFAKSEQPGLLEYVVHWIQDHSRFVAWVLTRWAFQSALLCTN